MNWANLRRKSNAELWANQWVTIVNGLGAIKWLLISKHLWGESFVNKMSDTCRVIFQVVYLNLDIQLRWVGNTLTSFHWIPCWHVFAIDVPWPYGNSKEKKLSICVFQFPPDKALNVGSQKYMLRCLFETNAFLQCGGSWKMLVVVTFSCHQIWWPCFLIGSCIFGEYMQLKVLLGYWSCFQEMMFAYYTIPNFTYLQSTGQCGHRRLLGRFRKHLCRDEGTQKAGLHRWRHPRLRRRSCDRCYCVWCIGIWGRGPCQHIDIQAKWDEAPQRSAIIVENAIVYTTVYPYPARDGTCQDPVMVCQYTIVFFVHIYVTNVYRGHEFVV